MTFITVIKANTFAEDTIDIQLDNGIFSGSFTGNLIGNVNGASFIESEIVCATTKIVSDDIFPKTPGANVNVNTDLNVIGNVYANGLPLGTGNVSGVADLIISGNLDLQCANITNVDEFYVTDIYPKTPGANVNVNTDLNVTGNVYANGLPLGTGNVSAIADLVVDGNLDLQCYNITNVANIYVDNIYEKTVSATVKFQDILTITSSAERIQFDAGVVIGNTSSSASHVRALAIGPGSTTTGDNCIAIGIGSQASDETSIAIGDRAIANVYGATAIGKIARSEAPYAIAIGSGFFGNGTKAIGYRGIAIGAKSEAGLLSSHYGPIAIGSEAQTSNSHSISLGSYSSAIGSKALCIGYQSTADGFRSIAIGDNALASTTGARNISIGYQSESIANDAIALGHGTNSKGSSCIAIGNFANASDGSPYNAYSIAIGGGTNAANAAESSGLNSISFGRNTRSTGTNSVAIGYAAESLTNNYIQLGQATNSGSGAQLKFRSQIIGNEGWIGGGLTAAFIDTGGNIVRGNALSIVNGNVDLECANITNVANIYVDNIYEKTVSATVKFQDILTITSSAERIQFDAGVVIGNASSSASHVRALAIGPGSTTTGDNCIAIGIGAQASDQTSIAIGDHSIANIYGATAIGRLARSEGGYSIAIGGGYFGDGTDALGYRSIAIGIKSKAGLLLSQYGPIAIGTEAYSSNAHAITLGSYSSATGTKAISIGHQSLADGSRSIAIGDNALASTTGQRNISIGYQSESIANDAIALGHGTNSKGNSCIAIGKFANASDGSPYNAYSIAIGGGTNAANAAESSGLNSISFGRNTRSTGTNSVAIGYAAESLTDNYIQLGEAVNSGSDAQLKFRSQIIGNEGWIGGGLTAAFIDTGGNIVRGNALSIVNGNVDLECANITNVDEFYVTDIYPKTPGANVNVNTDLSVTGNVYANGLLLGTGNVSGIADLVVDGNLDLQCYNITNVANLYVANVWGKYSPIDFYDSINMKNLGGDTGQITFASGVEIGSTASAATNSTDIVVGKSSTASGGNSVALGQSAQASGARAISIGFTALANVTASLAIGDVARASGTSSVALGDGATSSATNAITVGTNTTSSTTNSIAIGLNALSNGTSGDSIAIGTNTDAGGTNAIAIGGDGTAAYAAYASAARSIAIGYNSFANVTSSIAIGSGALAYGGDGSLAIGSGSKSGGASSMAIGRSAVTTSASSVTIGASASSGDRCITLGNFSTSGGSGYGAIAIGCGNAAGRGADANGSKSIAIGVQAEATNLTAVAIGSGNANTTGSGAYASGQGSVALGSYSRATGAGALALGGAQFTGAGDGAQAYGNRAIAIGQQSEATAQSSIAIGGALFLPTKASGTNAIAIGYLTHAYSTSAIAIGTRTVASSGVYTIAIGGGSSTTTAAYALGTSAISIGRASRAQGSMSIAIGGGGATANSGALVTSTSGIGIGYQSFVFGTNGVAIGNGAITGNTNGVAIGTGATTSGTDRSFALVVNSSSITTSSGGRPQLQCVVNGTNREIPLNVTDGLSITNGNLDLECNNITNVANLYVANIWGKNSPIDFYDSINIKNSGGDTGQITFESGIEIGNASTSTNDSSSIAIGKGSSTSANDAIAIGAGATVPSGNTNSIAIGTNITATQPGGLFMLHRGPGAYTINTAGFIAGTNELVEITSSRRFKEDIRDLEEVSDIFDQFRPVRYRAKPGHGDDREHIGFIAEEVEEFFPEFATYDKEGVVTGLVFDRMIAVVVKELKAVRRRELERDALIQDLRNELEILKSK